MNIPPDDNSVQNQEKSDAEEISRKNFFRRFVLGSVATGIAIGIGKSLLSAIKDEEKLPNNRQSQSVNNRQPERDRDWRIERREEAYGQPGRGGDQRIESQEDLYGVSIPELRETLLRSGILVLTHNGTSESENEFWRVTGTPDLGPVQSIKRFGSKIVRKRTPLRIITGQDADGQDILRNVATTDCYIVDATGGVLPSNISEILGDKKFGLILVAGHVWDIEKLAELSDQFRARESLLMLGGCRTAPAIRKFHKPERLVAGPTVGIHTETFTHLTKITAATIVGRQCNNWPEFFENLKRNYSTLIQRNPENWIFPGNPLYGNYSRRGW